MKTCIPIQKLYALIITFLPILSACTTTHETVPNATIQEQYTDNIVPCPAHNIEYPQVSKSFEYCIIRYDIDAQGHTHNLDVKQCTRDDMEADAIQSVEGLLFDPIIKNGQPIGCFDAVAAYKVKIDVANIKYGEQ